MVAKSYQGLEIVGNPYEVNGKMYVKVKQVSGTVRQVRWYSEAEYKKMYPNESVENSQKPQKEILGFVNGFITIFKGNTFEYKEWFKEQGCVYRKFWGWGLPSNVELTEELPVGVEAIRLDWDLVSSNGELLPEDKVKAAIDSLLYEPSNSQFQGSVGDRLELELTVTKAIPLSGFYGESTMHIMEDARGNVYVWTTASKTWSEGSVHNVRGTVKDHRTYRNVNQTILTRCSERKVGK